MTDKQPVNENLPTIEELRAEIIIELTCGGSMHFALGRAPSECRTLGGTDE